jgi:hypothetical protein
MVRRVEGGGTFDIRHIVSDEKVFCLKKAVIRQKSLSESVPFGRVRSITEKCYRMDDPQDSGLIECSKSWPRMSRHGI